MTKEISPMRQRQIDKVINKKPPEFLASGKKYVPFEGARKTARLENLLSMQLVSNSSSAIDFKALFVLNVSMGLALMGFYASIQIGIIYAHLITFVLFATVSMNAYDCVKECSMPSTIRHSDNSSALSSMVCANDRKQDKLKEATKALFAQVLTNAMIVALWGITAWI
ncbi:hypothetical protein N9137_01065 [Pseudomonadales bacterium]|nr:hypothetical protein [Pseudomonadales bacterium]